MDSLTFIAEVTNALTWPLTALILRKPLTGLILILRGLRAQYKHLTIELPDTPPDSQIKSKLP